MSPADAMRRNLNKGSVAKFRQTVIMIMEKLIPKKPKISVGDVKQCDFNTVNSKYNSNFLS